MSAPTISVAMPAYNAARWIRESLESVLAQTSPADEVIVVDDGSTDETATEARAFGDAIRLIQQDNAGVAAAWNTAFRASRCEYIAMCPADDLWDPRKLEFQREVLAADPDIDVSFTGARFFGLEERGFEGPATTGRQDAAVLLRQMYDADCVAAPTTVTRRALFDRLGGFREELAAEDYEFWLRALVAGARFHYDSRILVHLRQHGGNVSSQALAMWEMNHLLHTEYGDAVADPALVERTLAHDLRRIGRCHLGLGDPSSARRAYRASLRHRIHPSSLAWAGTLGLPGASRLLRRVAAARRP